MEGKILTRMRFTELMKFTRLRKHLKHTRLLSKTAEVIARPEETGGGAFKLGKDFQPSSFYEMCVCGGRVWAS